MCCKLVFRPLPVPCKVKQKTNTVTKKKSEKQKKSPETYFSTFQAIFYTVCRIARLPKSQRTAFHNSRSHSTRLEPQTIMSQSSSLSPTTLKNCCSTGSSTIATCPANIMAAMNSSPLHPRRCSAERCVAKARASNR